MRGEGPPAADPVPVPVLVPVPAAARAVPVPVPGPRRQHGAARGARGRPLRLGAGLCSPARSLRESRGGSGRGCSSRGLLQGRSLSARCSRALGAAAGRGCGTPRGATRGGSEGLTGSSGSPGWLHRAGGAPRRLSAAGRHRAGPWGCPRGGPSPGSCGPACTARLCWARGETPRSQRGRAGGGTRRRHKAASFPAAGISLRSSTSP